MTAHADSPATAAHLFDHLVVWQRAHGRRHLPWQQTRDPYRVWLSEIMLQQTQVSTVLGYYERFLDRFPTVTDLANAPADEVMGLWSGLGYYSRARHLHQCARQVVAEWAGQFPRTAADLQTLPGIGPSTAAAIAAFCFGERISILDGNVKRVLSRALGFDADLAVARHEKMLHAKAQTLVRPDASHDDMVAYTQGLMDLGASLCASRQPRCGLCPLSVECVAHHQGQPERYPVRIRRTTKRHERWWLLAAQRSDGAVWLQRRPARGIWAGLFCPVVLTSEADLHQQLDAWQVGADSLNWHSPRRHSLTHRELELLPVTVPIESHEGLAEGGVWARPTEWPTLGLPAPVRVWLAEALA